MRFFQPFFLALVLLLVWNMSVSSAEKNDSVLESISFHSNAENGETISFKLNGEHTPKISFIQGENPRIVLDFLDTRCSPTLKRNLDTNGKLTKKIRIGIHNDQTLKTRVVIDLAPNGKSQYTQHFKAQDNTLLLTIFSKNTDAADKEKEKKEAKTKPAQVPDAKKPAPSVQKELAGASMGAGRGKTAEKKIDTKAAKVGKTAQNKTADKKDAEPRNLPAGVPVPEKTDAVATGTAASEASASARKAVPSVPDKDVVKTPEKGMPLTSEPENSTTLTHPTDTPAADSTLPKDLKNSKPEIIGEKKTAVEKEHQDESKKEVSGTKSAGKKPQPLLSAVTFEKTSTKGEMIIFKLNGFYPPKVVGIEKDAPRVICDFPNTLLGGQVKDVIDCHGKYVESVQITKQKKPDNVKVVLNLVPNRNYDLQQVFFKEDNLFVLFINTQDTLPEGKTTTIL